jgi:hypothetical protein
MAVLLVVLGLGGAVAVHHAMPAGVAMPAHEMPADHGAVMCLAVLSAGTMLVVGVVPRRRAPRRRRACRTPLARLVDALAVAPPVPRARAGPSGSLVLCLGVLRR